MAHDPETTDWQPLLGVEDTACRLEQLAASARAEDKTVALHLWDAAHHLRRQRSYLVGIEIALNRDEDVEAAGRLIMEANHGKR
jgi:hypothetical protein